MNRSSASRARVRAEPTKHKRTRSGCLNCRRKKRKCDEGRPACGTCRRRNESCEWGLKIAFRAEHAQCLNARHPSMRKMARRRPPREFEILDVTDEVIRDYNGAETDEEADEADCTHTQTSASGRSHLIVSERPSGINGYVSVQRPPLVDTSSPTSQRQTENAVADLLYFSQNGQSHSSVEIDPALQVSIETVPIDIITEYPYIDQMQAFTPEGVSEDGIFLPGSAYHELHSTLRNHLIQETRSTVPTRSTTPHIEVESAPRSVSLEETEVTIPIQEFQPSQAPLLSQQEECTLWKNYFDEIAPWLDKFDRDRHFQQIIPTMSKDNDHLRYSMLALSARQLELKHTLPTSRSLALYQEAIHMLLPHLPTRGTAVIATCVILCVLEMLSCSPKAWQRHLDGCASLMEAVGINGFVGGVEQALFWCFARMDICGGLISGVRTLIPISHWASKTLSIENDVELFKNASNFENWANYAVYLTGQVLDLLAHSPSDLTRDEAKFRTRWLKLWKYICEWYQERPAPLHPIMTIPSCETSPFPTILYSNPAAMSGNQMHHAASILMLQNQPSTPRFSPAISTPNIPKVPPPSTKHQNSHSVVFFYHSSFSLHPNASIMPKVASVRDLMLQHPRERLMVQPLEWTKLHLELLKCSFVEVKPDELPKNSHDEAPESSEAKKLFDRDARAVERLAMTEMKNTAVKKLVADDGGPLKLQRTFGYFCFGAKHEIRLMGAVFAMRDTQNLGCYFAFVQKQMITIGRENVYTLPRPRRHNPPAELVRELKLKQIQPADQWRDPYLLAVLIGLAQSQAEGKRDPKYPFAEDHIFKTCAMFTDDSNKEFMYFYSARVSVAFLSKFEYPSSLVKPKDAMESELAIQMKKIPYKPYATFKKRLLTDIYAACGDQIQLPLRSGKPQD
ncbi:hypothetical protein F53441_13442 [Fusarium austroafricanum]|uniref:Zn(2)-C6 fungal-type domain-containing protein n=1 Tax=Fusarium austroafricanum TaxID=2364996 RepID=A0A8H4NJU7_9HYPO|nr:hypothetical protein F53441_13442 [Fusarium austroafricanum]